MSGNDVIVRGNVMKITASPLDANGNPVAPGSVYLYLTYTNADGIVVTVGPTAMMSSNTAGTTWAADFDTSVAQAGPLFGSVRTVNPSAAVDFKRRLSANPPNPDPMP
jgi:hypothetical protein